MPRTLNVRVGRIGTGWPDATNTGWRASPGYTGTLTVDTLPEPLTATNSGTPASPVVYENLDIDGCTVGTPGDEVHDVTFRGCRFRSSSTDGWNVSACGTNIRLEYCTLEPTATQTPPVALNQGYQYGVRVITRSDGTPTSLTAVGCDIYGFGNAFQIETSDAANPVVVRDCWIHDAADSTPGGSYYHHDGFLSNNGGPQYVVLDHNTIFSGGNTNAVALQSTGAAYSNITITNNLFGGFGYTVNIGDQYSLGNTNVTVTDNRFWLADPLPRWGPFKNDWPAGAGNVWTRNTYLYGGAGDPAADGKYWLPAAPNIANGTANAGDWSVANLRAVGVLGDTDYS